MLAELAREPFDSDDHLFEIKWDGTRALVFANQGVILQNRRLIKIQDRYPELMAALTSLPNGTLLDGEIVVLENGRPSFPKLQQRDAQYGSTRIEILSESLPATFVAFDCLYLKGTSLMGLPLFERKIRLAEVVTELSSHHVIYPDYIIGKGKDYFAAIEKAEIEGVMAKRIESHYLAGKRLNSWLKIKVSHTDAFSVIGYVKREGATAVSALALGRNVGGQWRYVGKVGSGFNEKQRVAMYEHLTQLKGLRSPPVVEGEQIYWIDAVLTARVRYLEITNYH